MDGILLTCQPTDYYKCSNFSAMVRIYISAPLFNRMEKEFNAYIDERLRSMGFETYLPQRDGYEASSLYDSGTMWEDIKSKIFKKDVEELKRSEILFMVLDGRVPDEGACVELGMAYTLGKTCIGVQTDSRKFQMDNNNPMIDGSLNGGLFYSLEDAFKQLQNQVYKKI